ncbi:MarR family transcriptional regulator [Nocardia vinacea]|uniref:MarR family transcriptional regulator n=1 Tax=Nocardia vinacea TaxID=96468 RepID=A0ABZ1YXE4_9NOCA|nr:MarR family transcriptional regulator [Nocardia vinacea]
MTARDEPIDVIHEAIILFSRNSRVRTNDMYDGMSFVAYTMLSYVAGRPDPTASDLAQRYNLEKSTVSRQLSDLEGAGLLRKVPNPGQPRTKLLELTSAGRQYLAHIRSHQRKGLDERLRDWSDGDINRFAELFQRFVDGS